VSSSVGNVHRFKRVNETGTKVGVGAERPIYAIRDKATLKL
jgi:hypothetical protein